MFIFEYGLKGKKIERKKKMRELLNELNLTPNELYHFVILLKNIGTKVFTIKDVIKLEKEKKFLQKRNVQYRTQYLRNIIQILKKRGYIEDLGKDKNDKKIHYYKLKVNKTVIEKIFELHKLLEEEIKDLQKELETLESVKEYIEEIKKAFRI